MAPLGQPLDLRQLVIPEQDLKSLGHGDECGRLITMSQKGVVCGRWPARWASRTAAALIVRTGRAALPGLLAGQMGGIVLEGDQSVLGQRRGVLQRPDPGFSIVTP